ncbi:DUF3006 domain-containing protein [Mesobacillus zeae]|uniref:DUF3006 domain-containing protein n=1 Tax=Mesobacillus zeae TaxID=1917180 RepID=A0A398AXS9_9BACI|nr:DUF3006 domain-containing protein [Mesobacillus zeae]RID81548.1 DUF3006 domain-containing protein [Mesobacillus zeae]
MKGIIDRFEGNIVVVEIDGKTKDFPKDIFPKNAAAGDVVSISGTEVIILNEETKNLRKEIEDLMDDVWED